MRLFSAMASLKVTLVGMLLLAVGSMLTYGGDTGFSVWVLIVPMLLLAVNLASAIATNRKINRQPGLLLFHVSLLSLVIVIAVGRLAHLDAQVEIVVGQSFDPSHLVELQQGPWHVGDLNDISFLQGPYAINYEPGVQRGATASQIGLLDQQGQFSEEIIVGDDTPLIFGDYRLYTSFNKGYSVILEWLPNEGGSYTGSVNMPSFPLNDYRQKNEWNPPGSDNTIKFWLKLENEYNKDDYWVLSMENSAGVLVVTIDDMRVELQEGESLQFDDGQLKYKELTMWMGYTIFYDPTLRWLFFISTLGVLGLGWHLWSRADHLLGKNFENETKRGVS